MVQVSIGFRVQDGCSQEDIEASHVLYGEALVGKVSEITWVAENPFGFCKRSSVDDFE